MAQQRRNIPFLSIIRNPQAYKNIAYLLLSFPAGLLYFLLLIIGTSVGSSLSVVGVGLFILWGTFILGLLGANLERFLSNLLLGTEIPQQSGNIFSVKALGDGANWRGLLYLFLKFPLGLLTFIVTVTVISFIGGLITAPLIITTGTINIGLREVDTLWEALIASVFGIALLPPGLLLMAKMAQIWRKLSVKLLSHSSQYEKQKRAATESNYIERLINDEADDAEVAYYEDSSKALLTG